MKRGACQEQSHRVYTDDRYMTDDDRYFNRSKKKYERTPSSWDPPANDKHSSGSNSTTNNV